MRRRTQIIIGVYLLGCALIYFGVDDAALTFWTTKRWNLKPEPELFYALFESAVYLVRPFLAVVLTFWVLAVPIGLVWGVWLAGGDMLRGVRRVLNRGED